MTIRPHLLYSKDHIWLDIEDEIATIGFTEYAVRELYDILAIDIDSEPVKINQEIGSLDTNDSTIDIISPITGNIIEINENLESNLDLIKYDPYGAGWIAKISIEKEKEISKLLSPSEYFDLTE